MSLTKILRNYSIHKWQMCLHYNNAVSKWYFKVSAIKSYFNSQPQYDTQTNRQTKATERITMPYSSRVLTVVTTNQSLYTAYWYLFCMAIAFFTERNWQNHLITETYDWNNFKDTLCAFRAEITIQQMSVIPTTANMKTHAETVIPLSV